MKRMRKIAVPMSYSWSDDWYLSRSNIGWSMSRSMGWSMAHYRSESWLISISNFRSCSVSRNWSESMSWSNR